jgi:hypothetical protein
VSKHTATQHARVAVVQHNALVGPTRARCTSGDPSHNHTSTRRLKPHAIPTHHCPVSTVVQQRRRLKGHTAPPHAQAVVQHRPAVAAHARCAVKQVQANETQGAVRLLHVWTQLVQCAGLHGVVVCGKDLQGG